MKNLFALVAILFLYKISIAQDLQLDWKSDLEFLKQELPQKHINLFFLMTEEEFNKGLDELILDLPELSNYQIADRLLQHIAKIGDSHTHVGFGKLNDPNKLLPFSLYWFSDGMYILWTKTGYEQLLGKRVLEINGFKIEQVVDSLSTLIAVDNQSTIKSTIPRMIGFIPHLEYFGIDVKGNYKLKIIDHQGVESEITFGKAALENNKWIPFQTDSTAYCWKNRKEFFTEQYFEQDSIYYVQYNICRSREMEKRYGSKKKAKNLPSFTEFENKVFSSIQQQPIKKIIIDLRFNVGGTSNQGTEFIKKLKEYEAINQKGKLYVVISRHTFSSGLINAIDLKNMTNAIFVGEEPGGKPNHYGDVRYLKLPSSGIEISYSTKYFSYFKGDSNSFKPDIQIGISFKDYYTGIDPVYEYIKNAQ